MVILVIEHVKEFIRNLSVYITELKNYHELCLSLYMYCTVHVNVLTTI